VEGTSQLSDIDYCEEDPELEGRNEIARFLDDAFPGTRETLVDVASRNDAPDRVVDAVACLPTGQVFQNVHEVWVMLGGKID
jgi:hypothetical protein